MTQGGWAKTQRLPETGRAMWIFTRCYLFFECSESPLGRVEPYKDFSLSWSLHRRHEAQGTHPWTLQQPDQVQNRPKLFSNPLHLPNTVVETFFRMNLLDSVFIAKEKWTTWTIMGSWLRFLYTCLLWLRYCHPNMFQHKYGKWHKLPLGFWDYKFV